MPVFQAGPGQAPVWCELEQFELIALQPNETRSCARVAEKEEIIVCRGAVNVAFGKDARHLGEGQKMDLDTPHPPAFVLSSSQPALVLRAAGRWRSITGSGVFKVENAPLFRGDTPYGYAKSTGFDNHYHDCDEYWIVFAGEAVVASEGKLHNVKPGDCLATGMGWHHDVLSVNGSMSAVYLEGSLEGRGRIGHLGEPAYGRAQPCLSRI
jgi:mannose-6-phosphate isomerase-like protein (cupin superfamily)